MVNRRVWRMGWAVARRHVMTLHQLVSNGLAKAKSH